MFQTYLLLYKQFLPIVITNTTAIGCIIGDKNKCLTKGLVAGAIIGVTYPISLPVCCFKLLFKKQ